jgi:outer membrane lipoprotein SlyB
MGDPSSSEFCVGHGAWGALRRRYNVITAVIAVTSAHNARTSSSLRALRRTNTKEATMKQRFITTVLAAAALSLTAACATSGPESYSQREVGATESVSYGTVESVRPVKLNEDHAPVGTIAGAAVGGLLGNQIGHGGGRGIATILGAVGGGFAGNAIEHKATEQNGEEVVVRLNTGATIAVVQGSSQSFQRGDRVRVLSGAGASRIEHL